jgi:hypothetical protein
MNNHDRKNSQELFVAENYGHDDPVLAVQTAVNAMFAKTFLAYKTLVIPTSQNSTGPKDLTPGKSQRKLYLGELQYLVMKPMICKCVKTNFCSWTTLFSTSKYLYFAQICIALATTSTYILMPWNQNTMKFKHSLPSG